MVANEAAVSGGILLKASWITVEQDAWQGALSLRTGPADQRRML